MNFFIYLWFFSINFLIYNNFRFDHRFFIFYDLLLYHQFFNYLFSLNTDQFLFFLFFNYHQGFFNCCNWWFWYFHHHYRHWQCCSFHDHFLWWCWCSFSFHSRFFRYFLIYQIYLLNLEIYFRTFQNGLLHLGIFRCRILLNFILIFFVHFIYVIFHHFRKWGSLYFSCDCIAGYGFVKSIHECIFWLKGSHWWYFMFYFRWGMWWIFYLGH